MMQHNMLQRFNHGAIRIFADPGACGIMWIKIRNAIPAEKDVVKKGSLPMREPEVYLLIPKFTHPFYF